MQGKRITETDKKQQLRPTTSEGVFPDYRQVTTVILMTRGMMRMAGA
jgi:hypothetical protein